MTKRNVFRVCLSFLRHSHTVLECTSNRTSLTHHSHFRAFRHIPLAFFRGSFTFRELGSSVTHERRKFTTGSQFKRNLKVMENVEKVGMILDGKQIAGEILKTMTVDTARLKVVTGVVPGLAIVQVGDRSDSSVYIRMKTKTAAEVGIAAHHIKLPSDITEDDLLDKIEELNRDSSIHGIIVQLPLDSKTRIDVSKATDTILPSKDVDGLHTMNSGYLARGELKKGTLPCTPRGCLHLIQQSGKKIEGSRAVVLGRSKIVGGPMAELLLWHNATVTICHSKTVGVQDIVREADILVVGIGSPNFVQADWIKPGAVVIDCGINVVPDSSRKSGQRIVGDVDFDNAKNTASYITPVPGGVGPMTVAMLLKNTLEGGMLTAKPL